MALQHETSAGAHARGGNARETWGLTQSVCAFWLGPRCYALDTALVGEVLTVHQVTQVPMSPHGVLGLFNLRGTPVALLDVSLVLALPDGVNSTRPERVALVLRRTSIICALWVERVEAVLPYSAMDFAPRHGVDEHPAVLGLLTPRASGVSHITQLDPEVLLQHVDKLRIRRGET